MRRFKNLLYVVQGRPEGNDGLKQAFSLARNNDAELSIQIVSPAIPDVYSEYSEAYHSALKEQLLNSIDQIKAEIDMAEYSRPIKIDCVSYKAPAIGIIKTVLKQGIDLVIKDRAPLGQNKKGFGAIDMQLLRDCPTAVWLCRPIARHRQDIKVAVAVDPKQQEPATLALSHTLLSVAKDLSNSCNGHLDIVCCRDTGFEKELKDNVFIKVSKSELESQIQTDITDFSNKVSVVVAGSDLDEQQDIKKHLLSGKPDELIPGFVTDKSIDILVMGTVARTGISGFLIGNTAENIMQQLDCALLTLKPPGFESSVKL